MKIKMQWKIILPILIILLTSNILVYFNVAYNSKSALVKQIELELKAITHSVCESIESKAKVEFGALEKIARIPNLEDENFSLYDKQQLVSYIHERCETAYYEMTVVGMDGKGYKYGENKLSDFNDKDYVLEGLKGNNTISAPYLCTDRNTYKIGVSHPLRNIDDKTIGTVFSTLSPNDFQELVQEFKISENSDIKIIDCKTGQYIVDGSRKIEEYANENFKNYLNFNPDKVGKRYMNAIKDVVDRKSGILTTKFFNKETIVSYEYIPLVDWTVTVQAPYSDFHSEVIKLERVLFFTLLLSGATVIAVLFIIIRTVTSPLSKVKNAVIELSSGNADLTKRIVTRSQDEVGDVVTGVNNFTQKLQDIVKDIKSSQSELDSSGIRMSSISEDTSSSITQILQNIETVNQQILNQSASVNETAGAVNEIASNIESLERMIETQTQGVSQASAAVEQMIGNINSVNISVEKMAESFVDLEAQAQNGSEKQIDVDNKIHEIGNQSETLQEANIAIAAIAKQTNLLAMNAAIEAAHAGDAGKGFSVVADEIRKLSETSGSQSKTIGEQLGKIQDLISDVVTASCVSNKAFKSVAVKIKETDGLVRQIRSAMLEQQEGSKQISNTLRDMNNSTSEVRLASQQMSAGNQAILEEVRQLQNETVIMRDSVYDMQQNANKVSDTEVALTDISKKMNDSISQISSQIDQFKV